MDFGPGGAIYFYFFSVSGVSETVLTELQTDGAREAMKGN